MRRGRSRTTASGRSSPRASPTSSAPTARRSACCRWSSSATSALRSQRPGRRRSTWPPRRCGGRVYGVDMAPSMVARAREALGAGATIYLQDLVELDLPELVDAVFSNATFHWIPDHDALFAALHRSLKPGGRLVAQCGGFGNID